MNEQTGHPAFRIQLSATPRGARLARRLAVAQLADWGWPYGCAVSDAAAHLVAELAANAVRHGRVRGRDFRLRLALLDHGRALRIEVTDARPERLPAPPTGPTRRTPDGESGRGLLLVEALAERWGTDAASDPCTKTVWCEIACPPPARLT
ncbi:ATP-binding protein [Streptomyces sp. CA-132043]|uniref:ATP-binding protein n=1 Tax=Streptomyces sp. CA-132043 TaxID=3240048 RepID=UPI003D93B964